MRFLAAAGLVMILAGIGAFYATERVLSAFSVLNLAGGAGLLVVAAVLSLRNVRGWSGERSRRIAARWTLLAALVVAAALASGPLSLGLHGALDLTVERSYTLSEQTLGVCRELAPGDAEARAELLFFEDAKLAKEIGPLVRAYDAACPEIRTRFLTHEEMPPQARSILGRTESTVVACRGTRCEYVGFPSEPNLTNALLRLGRRRELLAYFLLGHGEADLADESDSGFSGLAEVLRAEGVEPRGWISSASLAVPQAASVVIAAAPQRNLLDGELAALETWLRGGGRLLVLLEPGVESNLAKLLERFGFELPEGVLADPLSSPLVERPTLLNLLVNGFDATHVVVKQFNPRTMLLVPGARMVVAAHKPEADDELRNLVFTSSRAWLERDVAAAMADREIRPDPGELAEQELPLAALGRYPRGGAEARIVVIGDRDFASNRMLASLYNRDLFMNAFWWLAEDERNIAIRPKLWTPDHYPVTIQETLAYFHFFAFALPELLLLLGIGAWYRQQQSA
jgi:hypothetical protein